MHNAQLGRQWLKRADEAGVIVFARDGDVWVGAMLEDGRDDRVERFRADLNADPDGKLALCSMLVNGRIA